jgi:outer membrane protein assembly factor BamB
LICVRADSGQPVWSKNFGRDFGGKMMSGWGYSESPLVDGDLLICTPGGERAMLAALNKRTGDVVWTTAMRYGGSRGQDGAGYSSIVISQGGGVKQYVTLVGRGVIGAEAKSGRLLWHYERIANTTADIPTPVVSDDFVFCSSGYGDGGTALLKLTRAGGGINAQEVNYWPANQLQNHHGGMVLLGDHIYMGHGHNDGRPVCVDLRTGKPTWGPVRGAGSGSAAVVYADGHLYFRYQSGIMALIEADPGKYVLKSSFKLASVRAESWPHPVIAGGRLYLRDQEVLMCYDVRAN